MIRLAKHLCMLVSLYAFSSFASPVDSTAMKEISAFLNDNAGVINVKFHPSILKNIQGTYVSTFYYDSTNNEADTTFRLVVSDSAMETSITGTTTKRVEKTAFFCTGTYKSSNTELFVNYSTNDVFMFLTSAQEKYKDYGDWSILIMYQDKNGPHSMHFILKKIAK